MNISPDASDAGGAALTHGFAMAFYALAAVTVLAAVLSAIVVESKPEVDEQAELGAEENRWFKPSLVDDAHP